MGSKTVIIWDSQKQQCGLQSRKQISKRQHGTTGWVRCEASPTHYRPSSTALHFREDKEGSGTWATLGGGGPKAWEVSYLDI